MSAASALMSGAPDVSDEDVFGEFDLEDIFSGKDKLDDFQQALAIEFLRRSQQIQLERLQCVAEGALLAAEQVQDVRLDLLEKGPEVTTEAVILDLFIGFLLDSSIAGNLLRKFGEGVAKSMVRRNQLLLAGQGNRANTLLKNLRGIKPRGNNMFAYAWTTDALVKTQLKADEYLKAADQWRKVAAIASNSDRTKDATAILKAGAKGVPKNFATKPLSVDGDTPGVALLSSVQEFLATSRLVVRFQYERMETLVRMAAMTGQEARQFLRLAEYEYLPDTLKSIRERCKLLFEAIIWAGIFKFDRRNRRIGSLGQITGIDQRLVSYWLRRFGPDIERWNRDLGPQERFNRGYDKIDDWSKLPFVQRHGALENYFITMLEELPRSLAETNALTSNYDSAVRR